MEKISELIRTRRSVRSFDGGGLTAEEQDRLRAFAASIGNPYGIPVEFRLLDAEAYGLSSPVITGERFYVGAKIAAGPHMEEAFGYSFERFVLYAWSLGLGTTWIGGTMDRSVFNRAMALRENERMPCVSPVGRPAAKMSLRETVMRRGTGATSRKPFDTPFFDGSFDRPLTEEAAGDLAAPLNAVLRAPSAVNRQPWRAVKCGDTLHFYVRHDRGYLLKEAGDLQKVDLGIALCHFALAAEEAGCAPRFSLSAPSIPVPAGVEYIASYSVA